MNKPTNTHVCYGNGTVDIKTPVMALDIFTKTWCIDTAVKDDLSFRCKDCESSSVTNCRNIKISAAWETYNPRHYKDYKPPTIIEAEVSE